MQALGLQVPPALGQAPAFGAAAGFPTTPTPKQLNFGGVMSAKPLSTLLAEDATAAAVKRASAAANQPIVQQLASHIHGHWEQAKTAKLLVEQEMLEAVRARGGRYSPEMESKLKEQGGSQIYMMLFATKARQAKALLTDVMIGGGTDKPWTVSASPKPDLPPEQVTQIVQAVQELATQAELSGVPMSVEDMRQLMADARDRMEDQISTVARREAERAEVLLEDCLVEGDYMEALNDFLDDLTVFKTAFLKGPVVRNLPKLTWQPQINGTSKAVVKTTKTLQWERVDPFMMYPAPWAKSVDDAYLIERHRLSRGDLSAMIGVDGYNEDAIRAVLDEHGTGGLHQWLMIDDGKEHAEGRSSAVSSNTSDLIDALQYWGSVSGKMLREWGAKDVQDEAKEYEVEAWLIGKHVIKAIINPDPLSRRPYYADGYSRIPGAFWHNSLYDLVQDCQGMCNGAARALANNLGISSGPQVAVNIDRLPTGEELTEMYPWKLWQFTSDPMGSTAPPISFFQPSSNASELMGVYEKFSLMADEYSGIPRYMTGTEGTPGAGRTASGLSMMVGNASKVIRSLVSSLDIRVTSKVLRRLFDWKMQYDPLADFQGDLQIVPRGALSLTVKEAAGQARLQFLQMTANPLDAQIVGIEGRAAVLRETAKGLNMDTDKVVPSLSAMKLKQIQAQQAQMMAAQAPQAPPGSGQAPALAGPQSGQTLANGAPMTDDFSPQPQ
jgi:hypothetical protein